MVFKTFFAPHEILVSLNFVVAVINEHRNVHFIDAFQVVQISINLCLVAVVCLDIIVETSTPWLVVPVHFDSLIVKVKGVFDFGCIILEVRGYDVVTIFAAIMINCILPII